MEKETENKIHAAYKKEVRSLLDSIRVAIERFENQTLLKDPKTGINPVLQGYYELIETGLLKNTELLPAFTSAVEEKMREVTETMALAAVLHTSHQRGPLW